jgi:hypothetical protein
MHTLNHVDLVNDSNSAEYIKHETVSVIFAQQDGDIMSAVGLNHYKAGDALITGVTGDCWSVSRDRFNAKYQAVSPTVNGNNGMYVASRVSVLAKQMTTAFSIARSEGGDTLYGEADDWLLQYAPGDFGIVANTRFQRVYQRRSV